MTPTISAIIISGNAQNSIKKAVESVSWCTKTIMVAANSTDKSKIIAKSTNLKIKIIETTDQYGKNFAKWRNLGLKNCTTDWLLYIDTDEIVTPDLKNEILQIINLESSQYSHYAIPRANHFLGQRVKYGGTYPDYVIRLYQKKSIDKWVGALHEKAVVTGNLGYLKNDLLHFTHTDITSMLQKTIIWTQTEAQALYDNNHPPVYWWRFPRMMLTKLWQRLIKQKMYKDGVVGWISAIFETFNTFIIYARLWEIQNEKSRHF